MGKRRGKKPHPPKVDSTPKPEPETKQERKQKPIDRWLTLGGLAVTLAIFLLPRNQVSVVACVLGIFLLLLHPVWNFWWIEKKWWRRVLAYSLLAGVLSGLGLSTWPKSRPQIIEEMNALIRKKAWNSLAKRIDLLNARPELHDVALYFRGVLFSNARPAPDPDTYLSQIPQDSDLFAEAQQIRYNNYLSNPTDHLAKSIIDSLDHASLRNCIYCTLVLETQPKLSYGEITTLYEEFAMRDRDLFGFADMKANITYYNGVYLQFDWSEEFKIPETIALFTYRQLEAASSECLADRRQELFNRYDLLVRNVDTLIDQQMKQTMEKLRGKPLSAHCHN